ncbi:MAG: hypothetical protein HY453_01445 [Parcubacteria group bacterium]|nr:hypothetical protein [Parcubacteria group bacterium]
MHDFSKSGRLQETVKPSYLRIGERYRIITVAVTIVFTFLYLLQVNDTATKGYVIRDLEQQVKGLEEQKSSLKIVAAKLQSISRIQKSIVGKNFQSQKNVQYLELRDTKFASK